MTSHPHSQPVSRDAIAALEKISKLKPERVSDGFVTGPQALLDAAKRIAREAVRAHKAAKAPTGIEAAKLVADYMRLRFTDLALDGDDGDAANIIHILHNAGVAFGGPSPHLRSGVQSVDAVRHAFRAADDKDWAHLDMFIPQSGHGRFWRAVFAEVRAALPLPDTARGRERDLGICLDCGVNDGEEHAEHCSASPLSSAHSRSEQ